VIGAFPAARRRELFVEMQPLITSFDNHPWAWAKQEEGTRTPRNAEGSRWAVGKDLSFTPLRPERVVEVRYEHMEGIRFRPTAPRPAITATAAVVAAPRPPCCVAAANSDEAAVARNSHTAGLSTTASAPRAARGRRRRRSPRPLVSSRARKPS